MPIDVNKIISPFENTFRDSRSNRRLMILAVAERIFSMKGYKQTTIAEIAAEVGINDSVIYRHFKNKQDVLFSITDEWLKSGTVLLERDLQGLIDPESRLRKMIWGNLWYHHHYAGYSRIFLFNCLSSPAFYNSQAIATLRKYLTYLTAILQQGIREKKFRNDLSVTLMRDIIFGISNMSVIGFHHFGEPTDPVLDFEEIAFLVNLVISAGPKTERSHLDKASNILEAAKKIFAKRNFDGAKMTEIAKLAGVADGTVYEYFKSKEALLFSLPIQRFREFGKDLSDSLNPKSVVYKLNRTIKYYFLNFLADPHFMRIFILNLYLNKDFYFSEAFDAYQSYYKLFEAIMEEGKVTGVFRLEINSRIFRNLVLGTFSQMALRWLMDSNATELDMIKEVNQVTDIISRAVLTENSRERAEAV